MSFAERFWWFMTACSVVWYLTITILVSVRGAIDIKHMLRRLDEQHGGSAIDESARSDDRPPGA